MIPLDVNLENYLLPEMREPLMPERFQQVNVAKMTVRAYDREADQVVTITGDMHGGTITALPADESDRNLGIRIDDAANGSRWAAFTDADLWTLAGGDWGTDDTGNTLHAEIDAEIKRRRQA